MVSSLQYNFTGYSIWLNTIIIRARIDPYDSIWINIMFAV